MICVLIGYPGSQRIVDASKYLTRKYLPIDFDIIYLNYEGAIEKWASYLIGFLEYMTDEYIILALDDYLISDHLDTEIYKQALSEMGGDVICVKLCHSTEQEHVEYPITTQYCIWNVKYLGWLLFQTQTPWRFEIRGSQLFKEWNKKVLHRPCLKYFTNSSISGRWEGVRLDGLSEEDKKYIKENNLINE